MRTLSLVALGIVLGVLACATAAPEDGTGSASMQAIVDRIAAARPPDARLSIHAPEPDGGELRIAASTVPGRVGEASDPEDLESSRTGRPVEIKEGHNLDYTVPVKDASGRTLAVVGVTISGASGGSEADLRAKAKAVAAEAAAAIHDAR